MLTSRLVGLAMTSVVVLGGVAAPPALAADVDAPTRVGLAGTVVEVVAEPTPGESSGSTAGTTAGLLLVDGTLVAVDGLTAGVTSGAQVRVEVTGEPSDALAAGTALDVVPGTVRVTSAAPQPTTAAVEAPPRPVTVVVADLGAGEEHVPTDDELTTMVRTASDYWSDQSDGRITFTTAGPPVRYGSRLACTDDVGVWNEAQARSGFRYGQGGHLVVVLLDEGTGCRRGLSSRGPDVDTGGLVLLSTDSNPALTARELGHNLGLGRADTFECTEDERQDYATPSGRPVAPCWAVAYGDGLDVMSDSYFYETPPSLSAAGRASIGLLRPEERRSVAGAGTTAVELAPLAGPHRAGVKDLSVTDPRSGVVYRVENRVAVGRDASTMRGFRSPDGLRVLRTPGLPGGSTLVLDPTPTERWDLENSADLKRTLQPGDVWRSATGGVEIRTTPQPDGRALARVSLARDGEAHDVLRTTTTTLAATTLYREGTTRVRGTVSGGPGVMPPEGTVTVDVAGTSTSAVVAPDGSFAVDVTPPTGGEQVLRASFRPTSPDWWTPSSTERTVDVSEATPVEVVFTTATGVRPDAVTPAVLDVRLPRQGVVDGTVTVTGAAGVLATAPVADGAARLALPLLPGGTHPLVVAYDGGRDARPGTRSLTLEVRRVGSTTAVGVASAPSGLRAGVLSVDVASPLAATGVVDVLQHDRLVASGTVADGTALVTLGRLDVGTHDLVVAYRGDTSVGPSRTSLRLPVARTTSTVRAVAPRGVTTAGGQPVVVRVRAGDAPATGVVRLNTGSRTVTKVALVDGQARLLLPRLPAGRQTLDVVYDGTATTAPSTRQVTVTVSR